MTVNGKEYSLWEQFVEKKKQFIGGVLEDYGDFIDEMVKGDPTSTMSVTKITDISLEPNGNDSAFFTVHGEGFTCGFDVSCGGIAGGEKGWITFNGYGGHKWRIKAPD